MRHLCRCCDEFSTGHLKYCREENEKMVYEKVGGRREGERIQIEMYIVLRRGS